MSTDTEIDLPDVLAEVTAAFDRYERALGDNDVATLDALFRADPRTIRYGGGENLYGHAAIAAFRGARSPVGLARMRARRPAFPSLRSRSRVAVPLGSGRRAANGRTSAAKRFLQGLQSLKPRKIAQGARILPRGSSSRRAAKKLYAEFRR